MTCNMLVTKSTGKPVYGVLDWKSTASHIYASIALVLYLVGYFVALRISEGISEKAGFLLD